MILQFPANSYQLKSFWLVISIIFGMTSGYFLNLCFSTDWLLLSVLLVSGFAVTGFIFPQIPIIPYQFFNKLVRCLVRYTNEGILIVCFVVVYIAGGKKSSFFLSGRPVESGSLWVPWQPDPSGVYDNDNGISLTEFRQRGWFYTLVLWIIKSGNWWMFCLLPYIVLLNYYRRTKVTIPTSENIYTLY